MYKRTVKLKIHNPACDFRQWIGLGNWIDLAVNGNVWLKEPDVKNGIAKFDYQQIPLGVSMTLPKWYKAEIKPRSSMYKKYGIIQTNGIGELEYDFSLEWGLPVIAFKRVHITNETRDGGRICQFQIKLREDAPWYMKIADLFRNGFKFKEVNVLTTTRGGFGSTDKKCLEDSIEQLKKGKIIYT